ncbi:MAC/perforin domain-containing protein [uncultured Pontibacter sp.]|uniref:MAC/perforin domain-containing protein n=1 Tax=uncultured Pontibacter sp. TaxID=453356 RepID=UPI002629478C|nr:MAC/perforin domain-containing protein [uncultured Pontibacter sp.]
MKQLLPFIFLFSILVSCSKQYIEPEATSRTDDTITVTNLNPEYSLPSSAGGEYNLLGHGYDVTGPFAEASAAGHQIIDVLKFKEDSPSLVDLGRSNVGSARTFASENAQAYSQMLSSETKGQRLFKGAITSYFPNQDALSDKYIYSSYTLLVERKRVKMMPDLRLLQKYVTDTFKADIQSKSPQEIVEKYGTHILTDITLGAKLVVLYQAETENRDREKAAKLGLTVAMGNVFKFSTGDLDNANTTSATGNFSQKLSYRAFNGDPDKISQTTSPESKHPTVDISGWQQSLSTTDDVLIDFNFSGDSLLPLYDVIEDPVKREEVRAYVEAYLAENQVEL